MKSNIHKLSFIAMPLLFPFSYIIIVSTKLTVTVLENLSTAKHKCCSNFCKYVNQCFCFKVIILTLFFHMIGHKHQR